MSWFDIVKYNRKHYVAADKKHNDENVIEAHKEILGIVNRSKIKNKNMGRKIGAIRLGMPVITGEEFLEEPWDDANFFTKMEKFIQQIVNMINGGRSEESARRILVKILRRVRKFLEKINILLSAPQWHTRGNEAYKIQVEDVYKREAKAVLRLVREYNINLVRGKKS